MPRLVQTRAMLVEAFLESGRLEHVLQVMSYHPQYLEVFLKTQHFLLRGDGPLPFHCRHYIAIMAAARHRCAYLVHLHAREFLLQGGDEAWLRGLDHIPDKLRRLTELNRFLAHRPWLVTKEHIRSLVSGTHDKWSLSELMQALVLLSHFHALSSFVSGCGVSAEIDHPSGHSIAGRASLFLPDQIRGVGGGADGVTIDGCNGAASKASDAETSIKLLMLRMRHLNGEIPFETSEDAMRASFERVEMQHSDSNPVAMLPEVGSGAVPPRDDVSRFVDDPDYSYEDIVYSRGGAAGGEGRGGVTPFCTSDFSWEHEGYSLSCRLYMDVGVLLDDRFRVAKNLTYYTMGNNKNVDTTSFRHAIWYYMHCLHGIRHVEYDYSVVNPLLDPNIKSYVKAVSCYPESVTRELYDSFMHDFKHSEKVHVNLILLEARSQAELLYSLRAVSRYMCTRDPAPGAS